VTFDEHRSNKKENIIPMTYLGGFDYGRAWLNMKFIKWHQSVGGGLWFTWFRYSYSTDNLF
jgi:hypothetical protein